MSSVSEPGRKINRYAIETLYLRLRRHHDRVKEIRQQTKSDKSGRRWMEAQYELSQLDGQILTLRDVLREVR